MLLKFIVRSFITVILFLPPVNTGASELPSEIDLSTTYNDVLRIYGDEPGSIAGISVSAGDINGDGFDDVIIGAERANPENRENAGEVIVVFGSQPLRPVEVLDTGSETDAVLRICGKSAGSEFGRSDS